jgi:acetyl-CoA carboxylase carboxyltransferase component
MGPLQAAGIMGRREIAAAPDPVATRARLAAAYSSEHLSAEAAAREGFVDELVEPWATRGRLEAALAALDREEDA